MEKSKKVSIKVNGNILLFPITPPILIPTIKKPKIFTFDKIEYKKEK
jgi:hypothetical protein